MIFFLNYMDELKIEQLLSLNISYQRMRKCWFRNTIVNSINTFCYVLVHGQLGDTRIGKISG